MAISRVDEGVVEIVDASEDDDQILSTAGLGLQPGDVVVLAPNQGVNGSTIINDPANSHQVASDSSPGSGSISSAGYLVQIQDPVQSSIAVKWSEPDDGSLVWAAYRGVGWDATIAFNTLDSFTNGWAATATPTSSDLPSRVIPSDGCLLLGVCDMASGSEAVTAVGGTIIANGSERNGILAEFGTVDIGDSTVKTFNGWPTSAYRVRSYGILLIPEDADTTPQVAWSIVGAANENGFTVSTKTSFAESVRLKVGTNSAVTENVVFTDPVVPDGSGYSHHVFDSGDPNTRYYYMVEMTDASENVTLTTLQGSPKTRNTPGVPANQMFFFGSCFAEFDIGGEWYDTAFQRIAALNPDFGFHLGDWDYEDNVSTSQGSQLASLEVSMEVSDHLRTVTANIPITYSKSDHDSGANNAYPGPYTSANRAAALQMFPYPTRPDVNGLYHSIVDGRIRYIVLDTRYFAETDGSTRLGFDQRDWLFNELDQKEPLKFIFMDSTWTDDRTPAVGADTWPVFETERVAIGNYIENNAIGRIVIAHGDQHCLAADDGTNNPYGGVPIICAAPFFQESSFKTANPSSDWSEGRYPTVVQAAGQFGQVIITDDGEEISWTFNGIDSGNTTRVTYTETFNAPIGPTLKIRKDNLTVSILRVAVRQGGVTVPIQRMAIRQGGVTVPLQ